MYFRHISTGGSVTNFTGLLNSVLQKSANRTDYLQCMTQILNQVTVDTLPIGLRSLWEDLPVGFHSHEIAKVPISDLPKANVYLVLKAYLFSLDSAPGKQGAVAIVPHEHVGIPTQIEDRFHQAITYALAAEGNLEIVENRFEHIANGKVKHSTARPRELRSIGYDNHAAEIHNFEAISFGGRAKAIVLAAYITAKNPDIYFQESIDTAERSAQLIRLIENGFTPYRPTTNFSDPFVLSPDLTLPKEAVEVLESVSLTALQQRVSTQWQWLNREIESHTISKFDLDATGASTVALSLNPFLRALSTGDITPVIVSRKPETCSCEDSTLFRLNYGTLTAGIPLHNELRLNVRAHSDKSKKVSIHIYISRATHEANAKQMVSSTQYDVGQLGVIKLAVNPINLLEGIQRNRAALAETTVVFHIHPDCESEDPVSNNLGHRNVSITAIGTDYFRVVEKEIREIEGVSIEIRKLASEFWTPQERAAAEELKKAKKK